MVKKPIFILVIISIVIAGAAVFYFARNDSGDLSASSSPTPSISVSPSPSPDSAGSPQASPKPTPRLTPSGSPSLWEQLSGEASCELKGEIKYLTRTIYDNQDALFTYKGVDHPGRLINWVVSPNDGLSIGPNLFSSLLLPDGESLIGVSLPENPKYKAYELTASITYGRLIDNNVKLFTKQCSGKTTVVLPQ
ncbi:MAG: hypothetical protein AAB355_00120 [Patescibacteria group bacterium]